MGVCHNELVEGEQRGIGCKRMRRGERRKEQSCVRCKQSGMTLNGEWGSKRLPSVKFSTRITRNRVRGSVCTGI